MNAYLVTARLATGDVTVGEGGLEQFLVEAETQEHATRSMLAWLDGHEHICATDGRAIDCDEVPSNFVVASDPLGSPRSARTLPGSYLIDGRLISAPR